MLLCILDKPQDKRGYAHYGVGLEAVDCVPLKFRDTVADADDAGAQLADSQKIGETRHETFVNGGHQLHDVARAYASTHETLFLVICKPLQVFLRATKGDRVAQGAGGGYVVHNFFLWAAQEIVVIELQVALLSKRNLLQVLNCTYLVDVDIIYREEPLVVPGILRKVA